MDLGHVQGTVALSTHVPTRLPFTLAPQAVRTQGNAFSHLASIRRNSFLLGSQNQNHMDRDLLDIDVIKLGCVYFIF